MSITYEVSPGGTIKGDVPIPGDKSISHRAVMLGALAEGTTRICGFLEGDDALATLDAFKSMGVSVEGPERGEVEIKGVGLHGLEAPDSSLYLGNAGTAMRLMAGLMAGQCFDSTLTGDDSLSKRPMKRVTDPLKQMGAMIRSQPGGLPPLEVTGKQSLSGIHYTLPMASAQVKSCLLLAGLYAKGETCIIENGITRDHTERMLRAFGYPVQTEKNSTSVPGNGHILKGTDIEIPADISSAAFFMVAASITPGSDIVLKKIGINPTRSGVITLLEMMGADITLLNKRMYGQEPVADIRVRYAPLTGINVPETLVPIAIDEFPVLFVAASVAKGVTRLKNASELRVKESDRLAAMADGLNLVGIQAITADDGIEITGGTIKGGRVNSRDDHRIAMAFAIAGIRAENKIVIENCENVATSFPGFVSIAKNAGMNIVQY